MQIKNLLGALILATPLMASASVVNFESAPISGCQVTLGGSIDGFTLGAYNGQTGAGFNNASSCTGLRDSAHSGTQFMLNYNSLYGQFTRNTGDFDLLSLWVAGDMRAGTTTVRFQGLDNIGGNVLYSMDVVISSAWSHINFSNWLDVKSFTWNSINPDVSNIAIDDFEYSTGEVPEPASAVLVGAGLLGLAASRRRKQ